MFRGSFDWNLSLSYFFRVPVVLSTAVVVAGGNEILNQAKNNDFFFIIPCFINDVSVLLIYGHMSLYNIFLLSKDSFDFFENFNCSFFVFNVSRWKITNFYALPCEITIQNVLWLAAF